MKPIVVGLAILGAFGTLPACGGSDEEAELPAVDCAGSVPTYTSLKTTSLARCLACHTSTSKGAARLDAPSDVNYDTYDLAKAKAHDAAAEVNEGAMPPKGYGTLTDAEKQALYKWAQCGTPQ